MLLHTQGPRPAAASPHTTHTPSTPGRGTCLACSSSACSSSACTCPMPSQAQPPRPTSGLRQRRATGASLRRQHKRRAQAYVAVARSAQSVVSAATTFYCKALLVAQSAQVRARHAASAPHRRATRPCRLNHKPLQYPPQQRRARRRRPCPGPAAASAPRCLPPAPLHTPPFTPPMEYAVINL